MDTAQTLIDKAVKVCGSRYAVAKRLAVDESQLSKIARGKEGLAPGLAARLAALAGEDPAQTALEVIAAREKDPRAKDELARLFKLAPATVALAVALLGAAPIDAQAKTAGRTLGDLGTVCVLCQLRLMRLLRLILRKLHPSPALRFAA